MRTCTRLWRSLSPASAKLHDGVFAISKQENRRRGKLRQVQNPLITRSRDVSVASCASDGAAALDQEPLCPSTSPAVLSPSEVHPRIRLARIETALNLAKSVLSALVTWEPRWPQ